MATLTWPFLGGGTNDATKVNLCYTAHKPSCLGKEQKDGEVRHLSFIEHASLLNEAQMTVGTRQSKGSPRCEATIVARRHLRSQSNASQIVRPAARSTHHLPDFWHTWETSFVHASSSARCLSNNLWVSVMASIQHGVIAVIVHAATFLSTTSTRFSVKKMRSWARHPTTCGTGKIDNLLHHAWMAALTRHRPDCFHDVLTHLWLWHVDAYALLDFNSLNLERPLQMNLAHFPSVLESRTISSLTAWADWRQSVPSKSSRTPRHLELDAPVQHRPMEYKSFHVAAVTVGARFQKREHQNKLSACKSCAYDSVEWNSRMMMRWLRAEWRWDWRISSSCGGRLGQQPFLFGRVAVDFPCWC